MLVVFALLCAACHRRAVVTVDVHPLSAPAVHSGSSHLAAGPSGFLLLPGPAPESQMKPADGNGGAALSFFSTSSRQFHELSSEALVHLRGARIEFAEALGERFFVSTLARTGLIEPTQQSWQEIPLGPLAGLSVQLHAAVPGAVLVLGDRNGVTEGFMLREASVDWEPLPTAGLPPLRLGRRAVWNGARWIVFGRGVDDRWHAATWAPGENAWMPVPASANDFEPGNLFADSTRVFSYGCARYDLLWVSSCTFGAHAMSLSDGQWRRIAADESRWRAVDFSGNALLVVDDEGHGKAWDVDNNRTYSDFAFPTFDAYAGGAGLLFGWGRSLPPPPQTGGINRGDLPWTRSNSAAVIRWSVPP